MKNTGRIALERETTIVFNEAEKDAIIWSASARTERLLIKLGLKGGVYGGGMRWYVPKGWVKFRKPRDLTEEQKSSLREKFKGRFLRGSPSKISTSSTSNTKTIPK